MKVAMIGVAALLLGVGGGAFVSGSQVRDQLLELAAAEAAAHEEAVADSLAHEAGDGSTADPAQHAGEGDPTHDPATDLEPENPDSGGDDPQEDVSVGGQPDVGDPSDGTPADPAIEAPVETGPTEEEIEEGARKLAKIFGAMQAQDAANVLEQMTDGEIERILLQMNDRLAAQILGVFDPSRAAVLSRAVLGTGSGT